MRIRPVFPSLDWERENLLPADRGPPKSTYVGREEDAFARRRLFVRVDAVTVDPADQDSAIRMPEPCGNRHGVQPGHYAPAGEQVSEIVKTNPRQPGLPAYQLQQLAQGWGRCVRFPSLRITGLRTGSPLPETANFALAAVVNRSEAHVVVCVFAVSLRACSFHNV